MFSGSALFGLLSALTWGTGDFFGGLATKRAQPFTVVLVAEFVGAILLAVLALFAREAFPTGTDLGWCAAAGLAGSIGMVALYAGLASGHMGIVAPISAIVAAIVPIVTTIFTEGPPTGLQFLGFVVALAAVWLLASSGERNVTLAELRLAVLAGLGFGFYFVLIDRVANGGAFWDLTVARTTAGLVLVVVVLVTRRPLLPPRAVLPTNLANGVLDATGNLFFALAVASGRLDVAAVLSSLYPGTTVVLAYFVLGERLNRPQVVGVAAALLAIALIVL